MSEKNTASGGEKKPDKFCSRCGTRASGGKKKCDNCGNGAFVRSFDEYERARNDALFSVISSAMAEFFAEEHKRIADEMAEQTEEIKSAVLKALKTAPEVDNGISDNRDETQAGDRDGAQADEETEDLSSLCDDEPPKSDSPILLNYDREQFEITGSVLEKYKGISPTPELPTGLTEIGSNAFRDSFITRVIVPRGVTKIGMWAFCGCRELNRIVFPNTLTEIDDHAFASCVSLEEIVFPASLERIGKGAFGSCEKLVDITVDGENKSLSHAFGGIIEEKNKVLVYGNAQTRLTSKSGVRVIGAWAVTGHRDIEEFLIPRSVTRICSYAFGWCENMKRIIYEGTVDEWNKVAKEAHWDNNIPSLYVVCRDGKRKA